MNTLKFLTFSIFTVLLLLTSCTGETEEKDKTLTVDQLTGNWSLAAADRDGQETKSLEGTFMNFSKDRMVCNFTGEEVDSKFTLNKDEIVQGTQSYKIESFTASELVTTTTLMGFDFKLTFTKSE